MESSVITEIRRIQRMSVSELKAKWRELYDGEESRSRNRDYLVKRLCWRAQEIRFGGLSDGTRQRIDELAPEFTCARTPAVALTTLPDEHRPRRDPRLPSPGTLIAKAYKGRELRVVVRDDGIELDGTMYPTATALAKAVTGSKSINGNLFLGITKRKRR